RLHGLSRQRAGRGIRLQLHLAGGQDPGARNTVGVCDEEIRHHPSAEVSKAVQHPLGARAMAIKTYADVQNLINTFLSDNGITPGPPHNDFWNGSYDAFVNGYVPGVTDPTTGDKIKILEIN